VNPHRRPVSEAALLRAVKRHVWHERHRFLATCALGVEDLLEAEVRALPDIDEVVPRSGGVAFLAPFDTVYDALLRLRIAEALRVYLADDLPASTFPMLHDQLTRVRFSLWLPERAELTVRVKSTKSRLRDAVGLERTLRRALKAHGVGSTTGAAKLTVHLHLHRDRASVSLDAGGGLHQRQGDKWVTRTTIRETTAAALVRLADVSAHDLVVDPFCGSGTIVSEALLLARGDAAGRRRSVPLEASPVWKAERSAHALRLLERDEGPTAAPRAYASDADAEAVRVCEHNLSALGLRELVEVQRARAQDLDLAALAATAGARAPLLLANPPYGRSSEAVAAEPAALLRSLLERAPGWRFALLYPHPADLVREGSPVTIEEARQVITGGLRNAMVVGRVDAT
jgi:putative N6-adenine-specific DNA methylase